MKKRNILTALAFVMTASSLIASNASAAIIEYDLYHAVDLNQKLLSKQTFDVSIPISNATPAIVVTQTPIVHGSLAGASNNWTSAIPVHSIYFTSVDKNSNFCVKSVNRLPAGILAQWGVGTTYDHRFAESNTVGVNTQCSGGANAYTVQFRASNIATTGTHTIPIEYAVYVD
ncbi:hypothetical protein [Proteus vulgaris]|uniref:hypothetical protein n=1 Tax=Proteus vulgaris TaxID=585 RepID=UPI0034E61D41